MASSEKSPHIAHVRTEDRNLTVVWADGTESVHPFIWLRDNCACSACGDKVSSTGERFLRLSDIPPDIAPLKTSVDDGGLHIVWRDDDHRSNFDPAWLRQFARTDAASAASPILWDATINDRLPEVDYGDVCGDDTGFMQLLENVRDYGFSVVRDVPAEPDEVERLAGLIGFIRQTNYGRVFEIKTVAANKTLAETKHAIPPHNDELFRDAPPGLIVFCCLEASADGGGATVLVDGFNIAEQLRQSDPGAFELLSRTPLPHRRLIGEESDFRAEIPMIALNGEGQVTAFRCNERTMAPLNLPAEQLESVYAALRTVFELVYADSSRIEFQLQAGEALVFDNQRVLHARTAFSGSRHIRQCHVDRDEAFSRLNRLVAATAA